MRRFWRAVLGGLLVVGLCGATRDRILYFDPDANHAAILNIVDGFNRYLSEHNVDLELQPVEAEARFAQLLPDPQTKFALVASTQLARSGGALEPLLIPTLRGSTHYRKVLVDLGRLPSQDLRGRSLAAVVFQQDSRAGMREVLASLARGGIRTDGAIGIPVTKDIDGLLALTFGQVQAALVTLQSIELLRRINPEAAKSLHVVYQTDPILEPPLCAVRAHPDSEEVQKLIDALLQMANDPLGLQVMQTMGFDGWTPAKPTLRTSPVFPGASPPEAP